MFNCCAKNIIVNVFNQNIIFLRKSQAFLKNLVYISNTEHNKITQLRFIDPEWCKDISYNILKYFNY